MAWLAASLAAPMIGKLLGLKKGGEVKVAQSRVMGGQAFDPIRRPFMNFAARGGVLSRAQGGKVMKAIGDIKSALPELLQYAKMAKSAVGLKKGGRAKKVKARGRGGF
jgi:hypothetical protein